MRSSRRDLLRIGALAPFGLTLDHHLQSIAMANNANHRKAKSCILLWLDGGPSHLETWDVKPEAPQEIRGPFQAIDTSVPGIRISELLPKTARICDKLAIVRSVTSPLGEHGLANRYMMTGYPPSPSLEYPSLGSVVARFASRDSSLPPYIAIPDVRFGGAGYLGGEYEPFETKIDPSRQGAMPRDLDFYPGIDEPRLARRRHFLEQWDQQASKSESTLDGNDPSLEKAFRLITSSQAKQAFNLEEETSALRDSYGPRMFGQSCLLARRLIERDVPLVTVNFTGWDTHDNLSLHLRDGYTGAKVGVGLVPTFDAGFATLLSDLSDRGLLDETLVIAMGEFGRTPKINNRGGRDHWPRVFSVVMAGGGVGGGIVVGSSDRNGESPRDNPVTPADLAHTIYSLLGIAPDQELQTSTGRPVQIVQNGRLIKELLT